MIVPLIVALSLVSPAASTKKGAWVPLVRLQGEVPAEWREALQKVATEDDSRTWVAPPAVTLEEAQVALGCAGWSDTCAGQITSMTGASMAVVVDVVAQGEGALVTVQQVKGGGGVQGAVEKLELLARGEEDLDLARQFVRRAAKGPTAIILVDTDVPGADVLIDGTKVGQTPRRLVLAPGGHELSLRQEGKAPFTKRIELEPGQNPPEIVTLNAGGIPVDVTPTVGNETHEVRTARVSPPAKVDPLLPPEAALVGWSLAGVGGAVALAATGVGGPWAWDLLFNRVPCGPDLKTSCLPRTVKVYGVVDYTGDARSRFLTDAGTVISASIAAMGVGGLLIGTGVVLATADAAEVADAAAAGR